MWDVGGCPAPQPSPSLPFLSSRETTPAPPPAPGSMGSTGAGRGSPAPQLTSPNPFSPLSRHECNISVLAITREAAPEGLLAAGQAEWRRRAGCPGAEWGQPSHKS